MGEILLATLNARYIHASVGLRYLFANLGELQQIAEIVEFEVSQSAREIAEALLDRKPRIVGFGVYIWNTVRTREVISLLKKVRPEVVVVLGGPEVSYEYESQPIVALADYLVTGEADRAFAELCRVVLRDAKPSEKVIHAALPQVKELELPYRYYSAEDIANRVVYVEASRGCPFTCEFCLSSIDLPVRQFETEQIVKEIQQLYDRGARTFKFIDRTFNLNVRVSTAILLFFLERMQPGLFVHFEMVPDRFPHQLREVVRRFPPGTLQLEIGVQTLNPDVSVNISRRQDVPKLLDNLTFLRRETSAYLHVDLIVGLPGEDLQSFGTGFDTLIALDPQEIQVGILKRLRGTPIVRHDEAYQMKYSDDPPYEVLCTNSLSFSELQRAGRFARYWDLVGNSGNFARTRALLLEGGGSPFWAFMDFSDWLFSRVGRRAAISLRSLAELVFEYLTQQRSLPPDTVGGLLTDDYLRGGRKDLPTVLKRFAPEVILPRPISSVKLKRQRRVVTDDGGAIP